VPIGKEAALQQTLRRIYMFLTFQNGNFNSTVSLPNAVTVPFYRKVLSIEDVLKLGEIWNVMIVPS
jgi:hypothetical protein